MSSDFISLRKEQLRSQIYEAKEVGDQGQLLWLRSQWVHRYGINTLKEGDQYEKVVASVASIGDLPQVNSSCEISNENPIVRESFTNEIKEETLLIEDKTLTESELIPMNDDQPKEILDQKNKVICDDEVKKSYTKNNSDILVSPPIPFINHYRRWIPSLEKEFPKAS